MLPRKIKQEGGQGGNRTGTEILNRVIRKGLNKVMTFKQGLREVEGVSYEEIWGESIPGQGGADVKFLRQSILTWWEWRLTATTWRGKSSKGAAQGGAASSIPPFWIRRGHPTYLFCWPWELGGPLRMAVRRVVDDGGSTFIPRPWSKDPFHFIHLSLFKFFFLFGYMKADEGIKQSLRKAVFLHFFQFLISREANYLF